jgi:hypothetical protein
MPEEYLSGKWDIKQPVSSLKNKIKKLKIVKIEQQKSKLMETFLNFQLIDVKILA